MSPSARPPAVAGMFYPESAAALTRTLAQMLAAAPHVDLPPIKAIVAPHAGYVSRGPSPPASTPHCARARTAIRRVILLGPTHRVAIDGMALPESRIFVTPLGEVPVDQLALCALPPARIANRRWGRVCA